jgi:periplasmic protein TonB
MSLDLLLSNVALYSLQVGLLIGLAAFVPAAFRLRAPGARLLYWQLLLAACLVMPAVAPWKQPAVAAVAVSGAAAGVLAAPGTVAVAAPRFTQTEIAAAVLAAGVLLRLGWLAMAFLRLRRFRRHSAPLEAQGWSAPLAWGVEADLRISEDTATPVTFGVFNPVVLLPANFHEMAAPVQEAILAHECVHVRRKDWLFTLTEELIRSVFWFHPAIWWLLGEIDLAREQAVDRLAVEITRGRDEYVDALLLVAGAPPALDLAPAPPFLRRRKLKHRVAAILKEAAESRRRVAAALGASLCIMMAACWIATGAFPLVAAPKPVRRVAPVAAPSAPAQAAVAIPASPAPAAPREAAAGPTVAAPISEPQSEPAPQQGGVMMAAPVQAGELGSVPPPPVEAPRQVQRIKVGGNVQMANIVSKVTPEYPAIARQARIQDHVILHAVIGSDGLMQDLKIVSGHPLLRQAALDAVRLWQFKPTMLNGTPVEVETEVDVNFVLP